MILRQIVYDGLILIHQNDDITTDFGRTQAEVTRPFSFPLDNGQSISEDILNVTVTRFGGFDPFSQARVDILLNGQNIGGSGWPFGRTTPLSFDIEDVGRKLKTNGDRNFLTVRVTQSALDGLNRWTVDSQLTFNLNSPDPPSEPPVIDPPEKDENKDGGIFDDIDLVKVGAAVAIIGGVLLFSSGFGKGLGSSVGRR